MPEMRRYTVTETRTVRVSANSAVGAARIAAVAFAEGQDSAGHLKSKEGLGDLWGDTDTRIRVVGLEVVER